MLKEIVPNRVSLIELKAVLLNPHLYPQSDLNTDGETINYSPTELVICVKQISPLRISVKPRRTGKRNGIGQTGGKDRTDRLNKPNRTEGSTKPDIQKRSVVDENKSDS